MSVTLDELKEHLRIDGDDENVTLQIYLDASLEYIGSQTGRKLSQSSETTYFDSFSNVMELYGDNVNTLGLTVNYVDLDGVTQVLSSSTYEMKTHKARSYITLRYGEAWPSVRNVDAAITISYTSGYTSSTLPDRLKSAVLIEAATSYEFRESMTMVKANKTGAVERLIAPMVIYKS